MSRGGAGRLPLALALAVLLTLWLAPGAKALVPLIWEVPARADYVDGTVELSLDDGSTWLPVTTELPIPANGTLRTGSDGTCVLAFSDNTVVALRPVTTVVVLPDDKTLRLLFWAGSMWVEFGNVQAGKRNGISMPGVTVAADGPSTMVLEDSDAGSVVKVLAGQVTATAEAGQPASTLDAGEAITVTQNGFVPLDGFDPEAERASWEGILANAPTTSTSLLDTSTTNTDTSVSATTSTSVTSTGGGTRTNLRRWGIGLMILAGAAMVLIVVLGTVLALVFTRRRAGWVAPPPAPPAYPEYGQPPRPPGYTPPKYPQPGTPPAYPPPAVPAAPAAAVGPQRAATPAAPVPTTPAPAAPTPAPPGPTRVERVVPVAPPTRVEKAVPPQSPAFCRYCGTTLAPGARFCSACGHEVSGSKK